MSTRKKAEFIPPGSSPHYREIPRFSVRISEYDPEAGDYNRGMTIRFEKEGLTPRVLEAALREAIARMP